MSSRQTNLYISGQASAQEANSYQKVKQMNWLELCFRGLEPWLASTKLKHALDYGSGQGFSLEYLLKNNFTVEAVDINPHMIEQTKDNYPNVNFTLLENNSLPFADQQFDLVLSSFVLFEIASLAKIQQYLSEASRTLKDDGLIIAIVASANVYDPNYKSNIWDTNFPENIQPRSGDIVKARLKEIDLTFADYYWCEADYRQAFADAALEIRAINYPLGTADDGIAWLDETHRSPFIQIIATKQT